MLCKNARLNNPARLADLHAEIHNIDWDIICFSETRAISQQIDYVDGHRLILHLENNIAAGVGILVHQRHVASIRKIHFISDRLLRIDLRINDQPYAVFAIYLPHCGYAIQDFDDVYDKLDQSLASNVHQNPKIIIGGDFNTQVNTGYRGQRMAELAATYNLTVSNGDGHGSSETQWTFRSSLNVIRRIDFILVSTATPIISACATALLDIGSDHRSV